MTQRSHSQAAGYRPFARAMQKHGGPAAKHSQQLSRACMADCEGWRSALESSGQVWEGKVFKAWSRLGRLSVPPA